jgi:type IV secretory pathway VirB4 component
MEVGYSQVRVGEQYARSFFVYAYPRYIDANWMSPVVNFDVTMDVSMFIYPTNSTKILKVLRNKVAQMSSSISMNREKGKVRDPGLETALEDAEDLRNRLQRGEEKFFQFALYFTIYSEDEDKIKKIATQLESILGGKLVLTKRADAQMEHAFNSCLPLCIDELEIMRNMNTNPLSTTFPFTSAELTSNEGILYGLNRHNDTLVIFDRFSLENANSVIFAKSGAGKSYAVKLEILRSLMLGTDVIVIDPENEYKELCNAVGGNLLKVSLNSEHRINPFDLPAPLKDEETKPGDILRTNIITLNGLLKLMLGNISPDEEGLIDKALIDTYAIKGITMTTENPQEIAPPTMEDLHNVLSSMKGADSLVKRLQKYTTGTFSGVFNKPTNVDMKSGFVVFQIRDLEDSLRPIAMYIILNYIWTRVRSNLKKRMLIVDEAWSMMQHEDSAKFLFGLVKRARKYYLGISTITQDVEDFLKSDYGKPIISNSSMQLLLKQAPSSLEALGKVFNLTEGEKYMLLNSGVGQGLFFAGSKHVAIQIIASYSEDKVITTNPEEILKLQQEEEENRS